MKNNYESPKIEVITIDLECTMCSSYDNGYFDLPGFGDGGEA